MKPINVGLIGIGTVGGGTWTVLKRNAEEITRRAGRPIRIMAVADVYDAVRSERPYKKGMSHAEAFAILRDGRASHFDPQIVDVFLCFDEQVQRIREQWTDRT